MYMLRTSRGESRSRGVDLTKDIHVFRPYFQENRQTSFCEGIKAGP